MNSVHLLTSGGVSFQSNEFFPLFFPKDKVTEDFCCILYNHSIGEQKRSSFFMNFRSHFVLQMNICLLTSIGIGYQLYKFIPELFPQETISERIILIFITIQLEYQFHCWLFKNEGESFFSSNECDDIDFYKCQSVEKGINSISDSSRLDERTRARGVGGALTC